MYCEALIDDLEFEEFSDKLNVEQGKYAFVTK